MADEWIDISVPLRSGMLHWPGDREVHITRDEDLERGDAVTLSHLDFGTHTGTHMDAPLHYLRGGDSLDAMPFAATIGPARVIAIADPVAITAGELASLGLAPGQRLLFKTRNSARRWAEAPFDESFVHLTGEAAAFLADRRVRTVGVDYLSVGGYLGDGDATHRTLLAAGIWIIEGLDLAGVEPGAYELICLPLRIASAEGAPARAVLRPVRPGEGPDERP